MTTSRSEGAGAIRLAAAVITGADGRTLLVRKRGTAAFMQAGGKIEDGEAPICALERELREELGCAIRPGPLALGRFSAEAANEDGRTVDAQLFLVELAGGVIPGAEIEQVIWLDPDDAGAVSLAPLTRDHVLPLVRRSAAR